MGTRPFRNVGILGGEISKPDETSKACENIVNQVEKANTVKLSDGSNNNDTAVLSDCCDTT